MDGNLAAGQAPEETRERSLSPNTSESRRRFRSRSPRTTSLQKHGDLHQTDSDRALSIEKPSRRNSKLQMKILHEEYDKILSSSDGLREEQRAEEERRHDLGPRGRLREDGAALLSQVRDDNIAILLQGSLPGIARCRANDCMVQLEYMKRSSNGYYDEKHLAIRDAERIKVDRPMYRVKRLYYHIICFDFMVDVASLIPDMIRLDEEGVNSPVQWGLMFRKWLQHRGKVDLEKIAAYIEAEQTYWRTIDGYESVTEKWYGDHEKCTGSDACDCPPEPSPPKRPILKDYTMSEENGCSLLSVTRHRRCHDMQGVVRHGWGREFAVCFPEIEVKERQ